MILPLVYFPTYCQLAVQYFLGSQSHLYINFQRGYVESENSLGWKGPLKAIQSNHPAVSRDIYHSVRLLRAPSSLTLNVSRDGAPATSLSNPCQGFTTFSVKYFFYSYQCLF